MADVPQVMCSDPHEMLGIGRRHLAVRDYPNAVTTLGKACELLAQKYGQQADECGDAYLWYGKSLLGLAREESGVLGDGIPQGGDENQEDEEEEDQDEDEGEDDEEGEEKNDTETKAAGDSKTKEEDNKDEEVVKKDAKIDEETKEEKKVEAMETDATPAEEVASSSSKAPDEAAGPSSSAGPSAPGASTSQEGEASSDNEEDEDEVENLQVAWEVLEIARDIFLKRGDKGKKDLADVYLYLGEVSLESETYDKAVIDMTKSLELFKELYRSDDRRIAETHYQIGLAHSLSNGFIDAITHFKHAAAILEDRIKSLELPTAAANDADVKKFLAKDPFYSVEGEIKELKELLPEIQEKIQDMNDYKAEAIRTVRESLGLTNGQSSSKENGTKAPEAGTEEKKVSDISHLVRRKRKPSDDGKAEDTTAAKKPAN